MLSTTFLLDSLFNNMVPILSGCLLYLVASANSVLLPHLIDFFTIFALVPDIKMCAKVFIFILHVQ